MAGNTLGVLVTIVSSFNLPIVFFTEKAAVTRNPYVSNFYSRGHTSDRFFFYRGRQLCSRSLSLLLSFFANGIGL